MGEVYRARDTRLDRTVAIKVLPAHLAGTASLRERFDREARAISALAHPHICALYDVGEQDGLSFLVMEFLEGETLAERLTRGALSIEEAIRYGIEIADALDKAHRHGIVHRDLKPGNVMLTKAGAKLLDFGLVKYRGSEALDGLTNLPTQNQPLTEEGTIVGTFHYMAPEQLEGRDSDARTDIFALGALLYEMITGRRAFAGTSRASVIAAVVSGSPPPASTLQPTTPPALERVIRVCLAKDPDARWQSAHDVAEELRWIGEGGSQAGVAAPVVARRRKREVLLASVAALAIVAAAISSWVAWGGRRQPVRSVRASLLPPEGSSFFVAQVDAAALTISPDGRHITFSARGADGRQVLWLRAIDGSESRPISGTEESCCPFWSPDGSSIGFFSRGKLRRVDISGGPAVAIADANDGRGGTWNRDGVIVFEPHWRLPLYRVPASGGPAVAITALDPSRDETTHRWPQFLPDGKHFIYLAGSHRAAAESDLNAIYVGSLDSKERKLLLRARSNAIYVPGYLLFVRENYLLAQPFDEEKRTQTGEPVRIAEDVTYEQGFFRASFAASADGTLAWHTGAARAVQQIKWLDRLGKETDVGVTTDLFVSLRLSPDGRRAVTDEGDPADIWIIDLERKTRTRFTTDPMNDAGPVWSHDGTRIVFSSDRNVRNEIFEKRTDGLTKERKVASIPNRDVLAEDWSPDGRFVAVTVGDAIVSGLQSDIWLLSMEGDHKLTPLIETEFLESFPRFSPDGKWLAYRSNETGRDELYAVPFPERGEKRQLTSSGITGVPIWRRDGREILFVDPTGTVMSIAAAGGRFDTPRPLFKLSGQVQGGDLAPDGTRFLVAIAPPKEASPITILTRWTNLMKNAAR